MRQKLQFLSANADQFAIEVRLEREATGPITLSAFYRPEQLADAAELETIEEVADAVERRAAEHFERYPLRRIVSSGEELLGIRELGRFAVPVSFAVGDH
ncbi:MULTISPECIES: hypothetical protein [Sphingomonas]|uniref:hypothetical protein n=1 Tax=Sphingomonas TaxID=13687 RepID=UPI000F7E60E1|nr:hypothetical protein [Sphingomonas sp. ABOLF]RSV14650.1 hypothetical protein CA235_11260 [Sphingomonas sp. ABOLF]